MCSSDLARTAVVERPATAAILAATKVTGDALFAFLVGATKEMLEQDVLRGDGGIGFQIETPVAVVRLPPEQRLRGAIETALHGVHSALKRLHGAFLPQAGPRFDFVFSAYS